MIRTVSVLALALLVASSFGLYKLKYQVQRLDHEARGLQTSIAKERQSIQLLQADWTYLNQPQRIQQLAERFLQMKAVEPSQLASIEDIPLKGSHPSVAPRVASARRAPDSHHIAPVLTALRGPSLEDDR